ncbi:hypothetical protein MKI86_18370, partial (plasmid) [Shinella sp. B3.7]|nr:hypothetical protein [Shinella sedimenti]
MGEPITASTYQICGLCYLWRLNRTGCLTHIMMHNLALSFIMLFNREMRPIVEQNSENHPQESSAPSDSTAVGGGDLAALPPDGGSGAVPAHLRDLTERARGYVEAASSA